MAAIDAGHSRVLDAGQSFEFFMPVRPGDILVGSHQVEDIVEKEGKSGPMFIISIKTTLRNQNGNVVADETLIVICR